MRTRLGVILGVTFGMALIGAHLAERSRTEHPDVQHTPIPSAAREAVLEAAPANGANPALPQSRPAEPLEDATPNAGVSGVAGLEPIEQPSMRVNALMKKDFQNLQARLADPVARAVLLAEAQAEVRGSLTGLARELGLTAEPRSSWQPFAPGPRTS